MSTALLKCRFLCDDKKISTVYIMTVNIATVKLGTAKVKGSLYELRAVAEDVRMQAVGGFGAAIDLFESDIVPSLLANCSTWVEINKKTEEELDAL